MFIYWNSWKNVNAMATKRPCPNSTDPSCDGMSPLWGPRRDKRLMESKQAKGKGEKERYTHLNAAFQRIARRDKKAFLSDQWKEIEENNRMGKTRDVFKKIEDQGNISCKDGYN